MGVSDLSCVFQRLFEALGIGGPDQSTAVPVVVARSKVCSEGGWAGEPGPPGWPPSNNSLLRSFGFASSGTFLNLSVSDHGRSDSLLLSWDEPKEGAKGYSLALSSLGSRTPLQNESAGPNITSFWFHGLTPGTRYEIEVTATLACTEITSQTVTAQTSKGFPRDCRVKGSQCSYQ